MMVAKFALLMFFFLSQGFQVLLLICFSRCCGGTCQKWIALIISIYQMYAFSYWYTYYDSLFLRNDLTPSPFLLEQLQIESVLHTGWPIISDLPQLARLFESLERFIRDASTWNSCFCDQEELKAIQEKMNKIIIVLLCQKIYGKEYWEQDRRRIQASFVHFFIIFKHFILNILPNEEETIQSANNQGRLLTNLTVLETLVNTILNLLKPIHQFLFTSEFQEQKQLTVELFQSLSHFLLNLPQLKKWQLSDVPKLMRYICLCNTLEFNPARKRSETFQQKMKGSSPLEHRQFFQEDCKSDVLLNRDFIKKSSLESRNKSNSERSRRSKKYNFFKFCHNLSKIPDAFRKKNTQTTIRTKDKTSTFDRRSRQRSTTIEPKFTGIIKSRTFEKKVSNLNQTVRKSTAISIEQNHCRISQIVNNEVEIERPNKIIRNKVNAKNVKFSKLSYSINLQTGKLKGWAVIREYVFNRIATRKIKNMIYG